MGGTSIGEHGGLPPWEGLPTGAGEELRSTPHEGEGADFELFPIVSNQSDLKGNKLN